jgi:eukaryotic-like serine/threonine-protein kinase
MTAVNDRLASALSERYGLERELGVGGSAAVFLARDLRHRRPVAIKVLHADLARSLGTERFLREIETTANLDIRTFCPCTTRVKRRATSTT